MIFGAGEELREGVLPFPALLPFFSSGGEGAWRVRSSIALSLALVERRLEDGESGVKINLAVGVNRLDRAEPCRVALAPPRACLADRMHDRHVARVASD
jgi:hypothetical protein